MDVVRFGFRYWKKYLPYAALTKICSLIAMLADLSVPLISAGIIDYILAYDPSSPADEGFLSFLFTGEYGAPQSWQLFGTLAAIFAALFCLRIVFLYIKNNTFQWAGLQMENALREDTYRKLLELDGETISRYNIGELLTTINRDTIFFKDFYSRMMTNLFDSCVMITLSNVFLALMDIRLLVIPVVITPLFAVALVRYLSRSRKLFRAIREGYSAINHDVQENIDAVRIVRSFAAEEEELRKFDCCNEQVRKLSVSQVRLSAKYNSIFMGFQQIGYVGTVIVAILLVLSGNILLGSLTAATTYVTKIISHITQVARTCFMMQNQLVSGRRLYKFLSEKSAIPDCDSARVASVKPHIRMQSASLTIGEKQVLKSIDLDIPYGKRVGIMGGTGSGKSALLKSLSRIFDLSDGAITIDGVNVKEMPLEAVRSEYAYVFQDVFLFSNTVDANIAFARPEDCSEEEVHTAAEIAQAVRFIEGLEDGYETIVGERGMGLSGGQKQRISIARALIKGAPVLVLDDASSALDMATEKRVLASLKTYCPDHTLLIAAHRVSSVMDCDEIVFLRDGEIVERGTAEELIALDGAFAAVWKLQTGDNQLDDSSYGKGEI